MPALDKYMHQGTPHRMEPQQAVSQLNMAMPAFLAMDGDGDFRLTQDEFLTALNARG